MRLAGLLIAFQSAWHKGRLRCLSSPLKPKEGLNAAPGDNQKIVPFLIDNAELCNNIIPTWARHFMVRV